MSNKQVTIVDNVWTFLDKASSLYGALKAQSFSHEMHTDCLERGMSSPIEHMFWIACNALCESRQLGFNPYPEIDPTGAPRLGYGVFVTPQYKVGSYRVDFLISQNGIGPSEILSPVAVELDGHDFHDKDKRQRSYEKARDRFLVKSGLRVLHFTGSDVVADPFKVAHEVLCMVGYDACGATEYNPADPLDMGV